MSNDFAEYADEVERGLKRSPVFLAPSIEAAAALERIGYFAVTDERDKSLCGAVVYVMNNRKLAAATYGIAKAVYLIYADIIGLDEAEAAKAISSVCRTAHQWSVFDDFDFYSVPDLTAEERRPPEFIIEGMLPVGLTFLSGAPKTRKSFLAIQMAIAVASGVPFWGKKVKQCDVVYLDLEGSKSRISARTERMSTPIPRNVFITNSVDDRLADGLVDKLRELHRQRPQIRLIIIDTFSRARGNFRAGGANAYDADVALLEPVQRMALEENISVLFVHHDKKGAALVGDSFERLSGTMGISGSADCVINLITEGKRFDGKATLEYNPRDAKGGEISLVFDEAWLEWMATPKPDLHDNAICAWVLGNIPDKGREGRFWSYEEVYSSAFHQLTESPGDKVLEQLKPHREELFTAFGVGVQLGVKSNGKRGIRIINLQ